MNFQRIFSQIKHFFSYTEKVVSVITDFEGSIRWETWVGAICGLIICLNLQWIYFDVESERQTEHALRRRWYTGILWSLVHCPLSASIIVGAAGLRNIMHTVVGGGEEVEAVHFDEASRWLLCGGFGVTIILLAMIGIKMAGRW